MALSSELEKALNEQLNGEYYSSYLYLQMAAHFEQEDLPGMSSWMRAQAAEEHVHAMKFFDHVLQRDGVVTLTEISAPPTEFGSPLEVFEYALKHEQLVTKAIEGLFSVADQQTTPLLQWFATEQIEEEQTVGQIVASLRMAGNDGPALLLLDRELAERGGGSSAAGA
jgi:ferritin